MSNVYRYPIKLDRADARDLQIIEALRPYICTRRAAHVIRDCLYSCLVSAVSSSVAPGAPLSFALSASRTRRAGATTGAAPLPVALPLFDLPDDDPAANEAALDALVGTF